MEWAVANLGPDPILVYATAEAKELAEVQEKLGRDRSAEIVEGAFRALAKRLAQAGVRRFVVAGGETSGAVVEALEARALLIGPEIAPGVPWTATVRNPCASWRCLEVRQFRGPGFLHPGFRGSGVREVHEAGRAI